MNQILYTIENEEQINRTKSIILFFAIAIIIFGLIMVSMGGYRIASAKANRDKQIEAAKIPNVELKSESNLVKISANHIREIKNIIYSWNDEEETILSENTANNIEETIEIPAGTNTLNVKVIDVEGKTATISKEFSYEGTYMDVSVIDNKSIKITVTDVKGLQSVSYRWNSEEEIVAYPEYQDQQVIEITSDIPAGINTIRVKAVNNENETQNKEVTINGITKPTIKIKYNVDKTLLIMDLNDAQGIQSYSYTLSTAPISEIAQNGSIIPEFKDKLSVVKTENKSANGEISITENLVFQEGFNYLEITVTNIEGVEETFSGWCAK